MSMSVCEDGSMLLQDLSVFTGSSLIHYLIKSGNVWMWPAIEIAIPNAWHCL